MKPLFLMIVGIICGICSYAQKSATINKVWLEHDVSQGNVSGMNIHLNFDVSGMKGRKGIIGVYFYDGEKECLKDRNGKYQSSGDVATGDSYRPSYDNSTYKDFTIFMPTRELDLPVTPPTECYVEIVIGDDNSHVLASSDYIPFYVKCYASPYNHPGHIDYCFMCHGGGKCSRCSGTGHVVVGYYTKQILNCSTCQSSGKCSFCQGSGLPDAYHVYTYNEMPSSGYSTGGSFAPSTTLPPSNGVGGTGGSSSMHGDAECPSCHRTGKCTACGGRGWYRNQYADYDIMDCSICHKTGKCQTCHGKGTIHY